MTTERRIRTTGWFSTTQAADLLCVPLDVLRYLILELKIERLAEQHRKMLNHEQIAQIDAWLKKVDPDGEIRRYTPHRRTRMKQEDLDALEAMRAAMDEGN